MLNAGAVLSAVRKRQPELGSFLRPPDNLHFTVLFVGSAVGLYQDIASKVPVSYLRWTRQVEQFASRVLKQGHSQYLARTSTLTTLEAAGRSYVIVQVVPPKELMEVRSYAWAELVKLVRVQGVEDAAGFLLESRVLGFPAGPWIPHITLAKDRRPQYEMQFIENLELGALQLHH